MPRYIDALEIRYTYRPVGGDIAYKDEIEALPTADVTPVIHAHWIYKGDSHYGLNDWCHRFECSVCGREVKLHTKKDIAEFPYCHCGAKMDEENKQ